MRTIFIPIYDGMISKNILRTDVFDILRKRDDLEFVFIVDPAKKSILEEEFKNEKIHIEAPPQFYYKGLERIWARFLSQVPRTASIKNFIEGSPVTPRKSFLKRKFQLLLREIFDHKLCRWFFRTTDKILFGGHQMTYLFEKYKPDLVFAANIYGPADVWALKQAQKRGIPNIGMVKSWDNLTTRGLFRVHPEKLIVHNHQLAEQAVKIDDYAIDRIFVSGIPHYDIFFKEKNLYSRESFWKKYGIDQDKKIILYCEPGSNHAFWGHEIWQIIIEFLKDKKNVLPAEFFVTIHPAYPVREDILKKLKIKFVRLGEYANSSTKSWEFLDTDMLELMYMIKFSDLVINTGSTMNIEAAILDKPIINVAFDGYTERNYRDSVRQYYDQEHLVNIVKTGGVKVAYGKEELLAQINELLENPKIGQDGRRKIAEEQCVFTDGQSGKRVGEYILKALG